MSGATLHDSSARLAYGVDLSPGAVRIVRASRSRKGLRTEQVLAAALPAETEAARAAMTSIQAEVLAGDAVESVALTALDVFTRWLQTPFPVAAKARKVLPSLLDIQLPVPLEQCAWVIAEEGRSDNGKVRLLTAAVRLTDARKRLDEARSLGLDPAVLDHEAFALWSHLQQVRPAAPAQARVLLHMGPAAGLLLVGKGDTLQAAHALRSAPPAGEKAVGAWSVRVRQVLRSQGLTDASEIAWIWSGPGAADAAAREALQAALGDLPVRFACVEAPETFLAEALAVRRLEPTALACNFRRDALAHPFSARHTARRRRRAFLAAAAAAAAVCAVNLAWLQALKHRNQQMQEALTRLAQEVSGLETVPRGQEVFAVQQALAARGNEDPVQRMFLPSLTVALGDLVERCHMAEVNIEDLNLEPGRVAFRARCDDMERANQFIASLQQAGYRITPDLLADEQGVLITAAGGAP